MRLGALATQNKNWEGIEKKGTIYERTLQRKQQELFIRKKQHKQLSRQSTSWRDKENYVWCNRLDSITKDNKDYFNQQHKQLDLTTIAPKATHWALRGDLLKTMVVNSIVN